ncbi:MAG: hypothetical protein KKB62_01125 [Nanoarchaeota archaeon]|nr:hypothetical protein [Nanoarchaeota archaeon]
MRGSMLIKTVFLLSALALGSCSLTPRIIPHEEYNPKASLIKEIYTDSTEYRENLKKFYKSFWEDTLKFRQY